MASYALKLVGQAVIEAWEARGDEPTVDANDVLPKVQRSVTTLAVKEALRYLEFQHCIELISTPSVLKPLGVTIIRVDIECVKEQIK